MVAQLGAQDCNAIGFTGADGNTIIAAKKDLF
jgi:acetylglutamate kinase